MKKKSVILVGHGSKKRSFEKAMMRVAKALRLQKNYQEVDCAYLEINSPSIPEAIERLVKKGSSEIRILPYFLLTGKHVTIHIPKIVATSQKKYRAKARIILCPYLGYHEKIVSVVSQRLEEAG